MKEMFLNIWPVFFWLLAGLPLIVIGSRMAGGGLRKVGREHTAMVVQRLIFYLGLVGILASILVALEVDLTGILATAGVATVAIGFAAQTSLSNYISGLFLMGEGTFKVGDLIRVGTTSGIVESIDLLSVKLRTLDNTFVRLPNEELLKSQVCTVTRYPIRRMDVIVRVGFEVPLEDVRAVLDDVATANPHCLEEPAPLVLIDELSESGFNLRFGIWFEKSKYLDTRNTLFVELQRKFRAAGVEFQSMRVALADSRGETVKTPKNSDKG